MIRRGLILAALAPIITAASFSNSSAQEENPVQESPDSAQVRRRRKPEEALFKEAKRQRISGPGEKPVKRAPATVSVIDKDLLQRTGVRFLPDAFRLVPGFEVQRLSSTESAVSVRGYNDNSAASQGVLGMLDGRLVYHEWFGSVVWDILPVSVEEVDRIEMIRGPGSFIHGPNAMHGMVSIVTKSPLDYEKDEVFLSAGGGSYDSAMAGAILVRREKDSAVKAKVWWDDISEFDDLSADARNKAFGELRYETDLGKGHSLDLTGGVSKQKFNVLIPTFFGVPTTNFTTDSEGLYGKALYSVDGSFADFSLQGTWTRMDAKVEPEATFVPFELLLDTMDVEGQVTFGPVGRHTMSMGSGYRYSAFETEDQDVGLGRHGTGLYWVFLQDEYALYDNFWITAGFRWDHHTVADDSFSPRLAAVWEPWKKHIFRASAGSGYRNPSLRELWLDMPLTLPGLPATPRIVGNKDLKPEQIRSFELAYIYEDTVPQNQEEPEEDPKERSNLKLRIAAYYNLVDRLASFVPIQFLPSPPFPPGTPSQLAARNEGKEEAYGTEVEVEYLLLDDVSVFANYSYVIRQDRETEKRIELAPRNKANVGFRMTLPESRLNAMLWATYFDEVTFNLPLGSPPIGKVDDYILVNARINYDLPLEGVTAYAQAFNLLDNDHRDHPDGDKYGVIGVVGLQVTW